MLIFCTEWYYSFLQIFDVFPITIIKVSVLKVIDEINYLLTYLQGNFKNMTKNSRKRQTEYKIVTFNISNTLQNFLLN